MKLTEKLDQFKYPLLMLLIGIALMLLPVSPRTQKSAPQPELAELLSQAQGVGEARVLISDEGVIVVCDGADDAEVRWEILEAVRSYTGFAADKICILRSK